MRRIVKAALGGVAVCVLILGATQAANAEVPVTSYGYSGPLTDLQPYSTGPFDGADAVVKVIESPTGDTKFGIRIKGIGPSAVGEFGAHMHVGPCVAGDPAAALGHYNTDRLAGIATPRISPETEVWLDLVPDEDGVAVDHTQVPFLPDPGENNARSIVIHVEATDEDTGLAGARQACLPLEFPLNQ